MTDKTLVIGGGGFIGRYVVQALIAAGRAVVIAGRRAYALAAVPSGVEYIELGYSQIEILRRALSQCNTAIDLSYAAPPAASFTDPLANFQSNVSASTSLFESVVQSKWLGRLVVVSSGGTVYGSAAQLPLTELSPTAPISPYGITKLVIERFAEMYFRLFDMNVVVVRPANAYGVGQMPFTGQGFVATAMGCIAQHKPVTVFGKTGTVRDYVHVKDVASGIISALDFGQTGSFYNVGSGVGRTNIDVLETIAQLVLPSGFAVEINTELSRGFDVPANVLESSKLKRDCAWQARVSFEDGLREMWHHIRHQYEQ